MPRIAITSRLGVGKSTIIAKVVERLDISIGGIQCSEVRRQGRRVGFSIKDIATGKSGILSHIECNGPLVGKYHVNLTDLEGIGVSAVRDGENCDLILLPISCDNIIYESFLSCHSQENPPSGRINLSS